MTRQTPKQVGSAVIFEINASGILIAVEGLQAYEFTESGTITH
jgi:hypothetical protein